MLFKALNFIVEEFNAYLERIEKTAYSLGLGNIALQGGQGAGSQAVEDQLVLSLINVEEERTLKNEPNINRTGSKPTTQNPPLFLNLYLLIAANIEDYEEALKFLSLVLQFFQQKKVFHATAYGNLADAGIDTLRFEIFDMSFEQTNNLWGILGSKLVPSILYKVRMISIQAAPEVGTGLIQEIVVNDNTIITE